MSKMFSESWFRVAQQRLGLRPGVLVRRQNFRGERWYVLENSFTNQFFRLRPAAYEFVARLSPGRTVEEVWKQCLERFPDEAPTQEAVIQLLSQLYHANLLQYDFATDSAELFQRFKQRRQREIGFRFLNIMFMRFPLLDPDRFLARLLPLLRWVVSPAGAVVWFAVVGLGLKIVLDNCYMVRQEGQGVLSASNLPLMYLGLIMLKTLHEFGHAAFCRRFGGEVHVMGVMLMIFTPMPYVDATSSWGFRARWKRVMVGAAGMIVEVFVAAIAAIVWLKTGPGAIHALAYNMMFAASISTLVFNLNPLLRFDGYYILSDLVELPNLSQRASAQLRYLFERKIFGAPVPAGPARNSRESGWLVIYGITSGCYRVVVFAGVLLAVADRFLIIGILMAAICLVSWVTVPLVRFAKYLAASPRLERVRPRAIAITAVAAALLILPLAVMPVPHGFRAPGVVKASQRSHVAAETAGELFALLSQPGQKVNAGQPLLQLRNRELELELTNSLARLAEVDARLRKAMADESADMKPLAELQSSTRARVKKLEEDAANLVIRARHAGVWVAPGIETHRGSWIGRGSDLGLVIDPQAFEFSAVVMQEDVDALFKAQAPPGVVRLYGNVSERLAVRQWRIVPGGQRNLPSPVLGWRGGGDVPVGLEQSEANQSAEPFFEVIGQLAPEAAGKLPLFDGESGRVRFKLAPEPLLPRWWRRAMQLFQRRYQV